MKPIGLQTMSDIRLDFGAPGSLMQALSSTGGGGFPMPIGDQRVARLFSGKIGELLVELELTVQGWHVERLDGAAKAANGDLIAIRGRCRAVIQVKTNGTQKHRAFLGYANRYLEGGGSFFNARSAVIETDVVVSVTGGHRDPEFYVFTTEEAEEFAQAEAATWYGTPKRDGSKRSPTFPVSPRTDRLAAYRDRWDKLEAGVAGGA